MSSRDGADQRSPARLLQAPGHTADLLARANREFEIGPDEPTAFDRLELRLDGESPAPSVPARWRWVFPLAAGFGLATLTWLVVPRVIERTSEVPSVEHEVVLPVARAPETPREESAVAPSAVPTSLPAGRHRFSDGTFADLAAGASADVRRVDRATRVSLDRGSIELRVAPQTSGRRFEVSSGAYRFEVLGTVFRVDAAPERVTLEVREGRVAVWQGTTELARVDAGERWAGPVTPERPAAPVVRARPDGKPTAETPDCLALARDGDPKSAERCFDERTRGGGLGAEVALYEMARLRRDVLGDADGALAALREYRARFPDGSLRREVDVSYVELLTRLGRHADAIAESGRLLASASGQERAAELHLLRGNIFRKNLGDHGAAEREYAAATRSGGALGAEALYLRGVSLEALGDAAGARAAYEEYLRVPRRPRQDDARKRLEALSP